MTRGYLDNLLDMAPYKNADKQWYVELLRSDMYWYELIVNGYDNFDTRKSIMDSLKNLKSLIKNQLDKRFIYFIASRKRIRFANKKPRYSFIGNKLSLYIEEGKERKIRRITTEIRDIQTGKPIKPKVETTDRFITFTDPNGNKRTWSIHDFLLNSNIPLGYGSEVHYVGYTKNPQERPIDGSHSGLTDVLYRLADGDSDIFVYYNLFKVTTTAVSSKYNINFHVSNAMIDEIQVEKEGKILEKCLILYFGAANQMRNRENEERELQNNLIQLANENKITAITMHYEMEEPSEYFRFNSSSISPKDRHLFTCTIKDDNLIFEEGSALYDAAFKKHA
ncbi:MAG TPA: hypothetical protein VJ654_00765 [Noviherbaspirillum sp.]|nr:hypothetical protein [Noviherbaspirillum sp.]